MTALARGQSSTLSTRFPSTLVLPEAPEWTLYDEDGETLDSGSASKSGNAWTATITPPTSLPVNAAGTAALELEFKAVDSRSRTFVRTLQLEVRDANTERDSYGLLWWKGLTVLNDTVSFDRPPKTIQLELMGGGPNSATVASTTIDDPQPVATYDGGTAYAVSLGGLDFTTSASDNYYPWLLQITGTYDNGPPSIQIKPVYGFTPRVASRASGLKRYLDKGRVTDIDPNLMWSDEELVHYLFEGVKFINAYPPDVSFWTIDTLPGSLDSLADIAAAWVGLNARYLAEGLSSFDFNGGSVDLQYNRTQPIETKMNELLNILQSTLEAAKKAAIRVYGPGTPPPGTALRANRVGTLGIAYGPTNNIPLFYRRGLPPARY